MRRIVCNIKMCQLSRDKVNKPFVIIICHVRDDVDGHDLHCGPSLVH